MKVDENPRESVANGASISVLIRSFNSEKTLERLLSKLRLKEGDEIVLVDSGSTDSTLDIAARHGARIFHAPPPFNYSKSLNIGFRAVLNPWILVISSHSLPLVPDLMGAWRSAVQVFPIQVMVGYGPNAADGRRRYSNDALIFFNHENISGFEGLCSNGNTIYRRSAWESIPFDEGIRTAEDLAWLNEALQNGWEIAIVPAAWTINLSQYSLRYMFRKAYSDRSAAIGQNPMSLWGLFLSVGSVAKKFMFHGMPFGNWTRLTAHSFGQFFGSYAKQDNRPW